MEQLNTIRQKAPETFTELVVSEKDTNSLFDIEEDQNDVSKLTSTMNETTKKRISAIMSKNKLMKRMESLREFKQSDGLDLAAQSSA